MKKIYSLLFLLFIYYEVYPQTNKIETKEFILDSVQKYEVSDEFIYNLLDTVSASLDNCIFIKMNRDFYYNLHIRENGNEIICSIYPDLSTKPLTWFKEEDFHDKGFFYYKEKLVLITFNRKSKTQSQVKISFKNTGIIEELKYSVPAEKLPKVGMGFESSSASYSFDLLSNKWRKIDCFPCKGYKYYSYRTTKFDTWESVAEKFHTTVDKVRNVRGVYDSRNIPLEGSFIEMYYEIIDGKLEAWRDR